MKRLNYLLLGAAGLALASCSQEPLATVVEKGEGNLNITLKFPERPSTRAVSPETGFGSGYPANMLTVAVYDADNNYSLVNSEVVEFDPGMENGGELTTQVDLNLATGKKYSIALFAQDAASTDVYVFDPQTSMIEVDYSKMTSQNNLNDAYDCFSYTIKDLAMNEGSRSITATLIRPVAQINWGTNDYGKIAIKDPNAYGENGKYISTYLSAKNVYTNFNLLTGEYGGMQSEVQFAGPMGAPSSYGIPFPKVNSSQDSGDDDDNMGEDNGDDDNMGDAENPGENPDDNGDNGEDNRNEEPEYAYVAMNYILAPADESRIYDLTLSISNADEFGNGPAAHLTTDVVVASAPVQANYRTNIFGNLLSENLMVEVEKNKNWEEPDYDIELFSSLDAIALAAANGQDIVLKGNVTGEGSSEWGYNYYPAGLFLNGGTFDGQGYSLTVNNAGNNTYQAAIYTNGGVIKNLTVNVANRAVLGNNLVKDIVIDNCVLNGGYAVSIIQTDVVEGLKLTVTNSTLYNDVNYLGGVSEASFTDCVFYIPGSNRFNPAVNTVLTGCTLPAKLALFLTTLNEGQTVTFIDCNVDGEPLTADNIETLLRVTLPEGASLSDYVSFGE